MHGGPYSTMVGRRRDHLVAELTHLPAVDAAPMTTNLAVVLRSTSEACDWS